MRRCALSPEQETIVEKIYEAFREGDYQECGAQVFDLGMTLGLRYFTPVLSMGISFQINCEPAFQVVLIYTVANVRLGDYMAAEAVPMMNSILGGEERRWLMSMLELFLRQATLDSALESARSAEERLQAYYYEAEARITDRDFAGACEMLRRCLELSVACPEREFARARLRGLECDARGGEEKT